MLSFFREIRKENACLRVKNFLHNSVCDKGHFWKTMNRFHQRKGAVCRDLNKMGYIGMFDQRLEGKEFCRDDYHQSLEHLNALSANIMLVFALVEAF